MSKAKRSTRAKPKPPKANHPIQQHVEKLRKIVNDKLVAEGIHDVSLTAMHFGANDAGPCPPNQHQEMVCRTMPDGSKVCNLECVPD